MFWVFLLIIILVALACFIVYREAEVHELHKMRAAFEDRRKEIETIIKTQTIDSQRTKDVLDGEITELDEVIEMVVERERKVSHII